MTRQTVLRSKIEALVESTLEVTAGGDFRWRVKSTVPLQIDENPDPNRKPGQETMLWGVAEITPVESQLTSKSRDISYAPVAGGADTLQVFGVPGMQRILSKDPVHLNLGLNFPPPWGTVNVINTDKGGPRKIPIPNMGFVPYYLANHADEAGHHDMPAALQVTDWTPVNPNMSPALGNVIAEKKYDRPFREGGHEHTVIQIRLPAQETTAD
jgi:hypothetical protein